MTNIDFYLILFSLGVLVFFLVWVIIDFFSKDLNQFFEHWMKKTLWLWLPFYTLQRLIKEVILKK